MARVLDGRRPPSPTTTAEPRLTHSRAVRAAVRDATMEEGANWGYQDLQPWQDEVIRRCEAAAEQLKRRHAAKP